MRWICWAGSPSHSAHLDLGPEFLGAVVHALLDAFHQSELPLVMKINRGPEPPDADVVAARGDVPAALRRRAHRRNRLTAKIVRRSSARRVPASFHEGHEWFSQAVLRDFDRWAFIITE